MKNIRKKIEIEFNEAADFELRPTESERACPDAN
jgi:hypothetical protein